jgi:hypothetical protein
MQYEEIKIKSDGALDDSEQTGTTTTGYGLAMALAPGGNTLGSIPQLRDLGGTIGLTAPF